MRNNIDPGTIQAALLGYQQQLAFVDARIDFLRRKLQGRTVPTIPAMSAAAPRKHHVSAEGRARIAEAQRRRWAAAKRQKAASA
jgi:hypothetical protein